VVEPFLLVAPEVREALGAGRPVVALETSVVAQGLPPPWGLTAAHRCQAVVREAGAVPALIGLIRGRVAVGMDEADLRRLADPAVPVAKAGARDLASLAAAGRDAGATVSATAAVAARAGIRVFATGGIGGVHRRASPAEPLDVSADLAELAASPVCVVSAGPKVVLDLPATAEALESLAIPVIGWRTGELPAFFAASSGIPLEHRVEDAAQAAAVLRLHWEALGRHQGVLLCVPPPHPLAREEVERSLAVALAEASGAGVSGKGLTPFLLRHLAAATEGRSREANLSLLEENARVAGAVAVALAAGGGQ
jgi:pseudouridine-5'-phosphate glycosidase